MKKSEIIKLTQEVLTEIRAAKSVRTPGVYTIYWDLPTDEGDIPSAVKFSVSLELHQIEYRNKVRILDGFALDSGRSIIDEVDPLDVESIQSVLEGDDVINWDEFKPYYTNRPRTKEQREWKSAEEDPVPGDEDFASRLHDYYTLPPSKDYWAQRR